MKCRRTTAIVVFGLSILLSLGSLWLALGVAGSFSGIFNVPEELDAKLSFGLIWLVILSPFAVALLLRRTE